MKHQRGWTSIATEVENWIKEKYPNATYKWITPIEHESNEKYGGGRIELTCEGYRTTIKTVWTQIQFKNKTWSI